MTGAEKSRHAKLEQSQVQVPGFPGFQVETPFGSCQSKLHGIGAQKPAGPFSFLIDPLSFRKT